ncbi:MAG TPA: hydrogenase maturation protease, partial [Kiritimatiellia bacterium]|nr:hydrogenase maturation protease [Kiritimatiellia bacterium]
ATAPENFTGLVRRLHPDTLVLLDAADLGLPPGTLRRLDPAAIASGDFGTHAGSLGQLAAYLSDCAGQVIILGIQPGPTTPGTRLSTPVRAALQTLARSLARDRIP